MTHHRTGPSTRSQTSGRALLLSACTCLLFAGNVCRLDLLKNFDGTFSEGSALNPAAFTGLLSRPMRCILAFAYLRPIPLLNDHPCATRGEASRVTSDGLRVLATSPACPRDRLPDLVHAPGLRTPTIQWTYALSNNRTLLAEYMQQHLLMDAYPMAPIPLNDHSIQPGSAAVDQACAPLITLHSVA